MTFSRSAIRLALLAPVSLVTPAQQFEAPLLGYLVDTAEQRIRGVWGVMGAAQVGAPIEIGAEVLAGAASPQASHVVVLTGEQRQAAIWLPGETVARRLAGVPAGADQLTLSPEGNSAAFLYRRENRVLVVSGLPSPTQEPVAIDPTQEPVAIDLTALRLPLAALAVSDDGQVVAVGEMEPADAGQRASLILLGAAGELNRAPASGGVTAISFASRSHQLVFATASEAWLVTGESLSDSPRRLRAPELAGATAVALDRQRAVFAQPGAGQIAWVDLAALDQPAKVMACNCQPDTLARLKSGFRLTDYRGTSLRLLDMTARPRVVFAAPAAAVEPEEQQ
ncbi:MAG: hypothetical protein NTV70_20650 [Acidobacteria bacterium]|nr:hypothetical protein [Acidobacteriota bacterium]